MAAVGGSSRGGGNVTVGEGDVMVPEHLLGQLRRGDDDDELAAQAEAEDRAVGSGQGGEVGVELRAEGEEVAKYG